MKFTLLIILTLKVPVMKIAKLAKRVDSEEVAH